MRLLAVTAVLLSLGLTGCMSTPPSPPPTFQRISFAQRPPFVLDVAAIEIDDRAAPPRNPPHVGHQFPVPPIQAVRDWASDRLKAAGRSGVLRVVVLSADAVEASLPRTGGIRGAFTRDQSERYDVAIALRLEIRDPATGRSASVEGRATRSGTVAEDVSGNDKLALWYKLTDGTISTLDAELDRQIRQNFAGFLRGY